MKKKELEQRIKELEERIDKLEKEAVRKIPVTVTTEDSEQVIYIAPYDPTVHVKYTYTINPECECSVVGQSR